MDPCASWVSCLSEAVIATVNVPADAGAEKARSIAPPGNAPGWNDGR
jgi:hypothetical protein